MGDVADSLLEWRFIETGDLKLRNLRTALAYQALYN